MINKEHPLPITKQCNILNLCRSGIYYKPIPLSDKDKELMRMIDEIHLEEPHLGARRIKIILIRKGYKVGRIHIRTLMRKMGIKAIYKKPPSS
ncbi:MAG TPA: IS3 family transposase [Syntrophorhabdaceae bacterium]|nr:IS3 family transposase [Syntrophorhabdaceae bacterium]